MASMYNRYNSYNNYNNYNSYNSYNNYNQYRNNNYYHWNYYNNRNQGNQQGDADRASQMYQLLASVNSYSVIFVGVYTAGLSMVLTVFGAKSIVGFTSLDGDYVPPTWTGTGDEKVSRKYFGIFMGMLIFLTNLFLVVAVIMGEFHIAGIDERQKEEIGYFAVERTAEVLETIFVSLAVTYFVYSIILFSLKDHLLEEVENVKNGTYKTPTATMQIA